MRRRFPPALPLSVAVCLLALVFPLSTLAQSKSTGSKGKASTQSSSAPVSKKTAAEAVAPVTNNAAAPASQNVHGSISFLSQLEREIIDEMNLARTEPQKYAAFIEEFKKYYSGSRLLLPGRKTLITAEGTAAVDEAISFLRAAKPLPAFEVSKGVCSAAADHVKDLTSKGITGHRGSDGSYPNARLDRYGRWDMAVGENIVYDVSSARETVIALLIDDGVANRGHRNNIFDSKYRITGISVGNASSSKVFGVINFTGGYTEKAADLK